MGYLDNGETVGFDIDLAKLVAEKLGVELEIKYIDWESKLFELDLMRLIVYGME
jgi:polar amino acid transport system substrate-binding protein